MDIVTAFAQHRQEFVTPVATATIDANRTLTVTATYLLSEEGRKASLLAGGDGRAVQELTVQVPAMVQDIQRSLPEATVVVRMHEVAWKCDAKIALPPVFGVLITQRIGPFTLRRE